MDFALILAGGSGSRINSHVPKQFLELNGIPIIIHTLRAFIKYSHKLRIILVLPEDDFGTWKLITQKFNFSESLILQKGGSSRFQSVRNGLSRVEPEGLVAIHDGVRPFVSQEIIRNSFLVATKNRTAVPVVSLKDSICSYENERVNLLDRAKFFLTQTPQTFCSSLIKKAYEMEEDPVLTDDASIAHKGGGEISVFEGSYKNIKISTAEDLVVAEAFMKMGNEFSNL